MKILLPSLKTMSLVALCAALPLTGCVTRPPPPSEEVRAKLGTVGILSGCSLTNITIQKPRGKGSATAAGAGAGFMEGLSAVSGSGPGAILVAPITATLGAGIGAAVGSSKGTSAEKLKEAGRARLEVLKTLNALNLQDRLNHELIRAIKAKTKYEVIAADRVDRTAESDASDYRSLTNSGITTVLEVTMVGAGLTGSRDKNAPQVASLDIRIRLVRVSDNEELYVCPWVHRGRSNTFTDWTADHGQALGAELAQALPAVADEIVDHLFLIYIPP